MLEYPQARSMAWHTLPYWLESWAHPGVLWVKGLSLLAKKWSPYSKLYFCNKDVLLTPPKTRLKVGLFWNQYDTIALYTSEKESIKDIPWRLCQKINSFST